MILVSLALLIVLTVNLKVSARLVLKDSSFKNLTLWELLLVIAQKSVEMEKDSKLIAMMVTLEKAMDAMIGAKSRKIGTVKVAHQLKLALVFHLPQIDLSSQQREQSIFSVKLFKVFDFLTFLQSSLKTNVLSAAKFSGSELSIQPLSQA